VDDSLGDALVVEVLGLFELEEVFEEIGAALAGFEGVFVIGDEGAGLVSHGRVKLAGDLMQLSAVADEVVFWQAILMGLAHLFAPDGGDGSCVSWREARLDTGWLISASFRIQDVLVSHRAIRQKGHCLGRCRNL
jgi:hypothetical protein